LLPGGGHACKARGARSTGSSDGTSVVRAHLVWRLRAVLRPPVTLGVRCLVVDAADRVLLVRHTYMAGWHIPGGGVDPHESASQAAERELVEETGLALGGPPAFFSLYWNKALAGRDHVALFVARGVPAVADAALSAPAHEIAAVAMWPRAELPADTVPSVERRLAEIFDDAPITEIW